MPARPFLRCLGAPALFTPTGEPIRFRTKKHLALLVYLAVEGRRSHRRDRLSELLWPKVSLSEARHSLATGLSILRPRLGPGVLQSSRDHVVLERDRIALDLDRLAAGDVLGNDVNGPLEVAEFLEGFEIPDSCEFMMWKDRQHSRLLPAITDALIVLIDRCRRTGDSRQIEQLADRMLAIDELSEEAIRAKMEARAFAGDRLTALRIFEEWKEKLAEEVGAVPSELVEGMAVRLRRRGWERTTLTEIPPVPTDQWRGRPFVGRADEYRVLYEGWEAMRKGQPGHVLVLGDSGVGKTTLVERLTTAAGLEGAAISRVQCYDLEREIPYAALGNLVLGCLDRPGISATPPEALAELARLVPDVRRRFPSIPAASDSQRDTARIRLTEAFHEMIHAIGEEHPVILVVDDFHLADEASLAALHLVMRRARGQALMVIMVGRPGELQHSRQVARIRESAGTLGLRELELVPLSEEQSRKLLSSLVSAQLAPTASVRRVLLRASGGFPMVLELLLRDWETNGNQSLALALDAMTADLASGTEPSTTYSHIVTRLVHTLDPTTQNALNLAALLGHRLDDFSMYSLIDLTLGQSIGALAALSELRLLRSGATGLEFSNELIRAHIYAAIPAAARKAYHGCIADRLLAAVEAGQEGAGLEIAWHCIRAGRATEATPYLLAGAREAIRRGAPHAGERALSTALPHLQSDEKIQAMLLLAELLQEQGRWRESLEWLASLHPGNAKDQLESALVLSSLARMNVSASAANEILVHVPELTEIITTSPNMRNRVRAGRVLAFLISERRDEPMARSFLAAIDTIPRAELDEDSLGELSLTQALLLYQMRETAASLTQVLETIDALVAKGVASTVVVHLYTGLGAIKTRMGCYDEAAIHYEHAIRMAQRVDNDTVITATTGNLAICYARLGRYDDVLQCTARLTNAEGPEFAGFVEIQLAYAAALACAMQGHPVKALERIAALDCRLVGSVAPWMVQAWLLWKADLLLALKRTREAVLEGSKAVELHSFHLQSQAFAGAFARWVAITAERHGIARSLDIIQGLAANLDCHDAIDQAEILCALHSLSASQGSSVASLVERLRTKLDMLPRAVRAQLAAWQALPAYT